MIRNQTPSRKTSNLEVYNIRAFYNDFQEKKRRYAPSLFCVGQKKKGKKQEVSLIIYKKIIKEFLTVYFTDLYMNNKSIYFFLGGFIKKVAYQKWTRFMKRGTQDKQIVGSDGKAIGLFWYHRPSQKMYYMVKLKKLTGTTNVLPQIERMYENHYNKDLLPIFDQEKKRAKETKTLYHHVL